MDQIFLEPFIDKFCIRGPVILDSGPYAAHTAFKIEVKRQAEDVKRQQPGCKEGWIFPFSSAESFPILDPDDQQTGFPRSLQAYLRCLPNGCGVVFSNDVGEPLCYYRNKHLQQLLQDLVNLKKAKPRPFLMLRTSGYVGPDLVPTSFLPQFNRRQPTDMDIFLGSFHYIEFDLRINQSNHPGVDVSQYLQNFHTIFAILPQTKTKFSLAMTTTNPTGDIKHLLEFLQVFGPVMESYGVIGAVPIILRLPSGVFDFDHKLELLTQVAADFGWQVGLRLS